MWSRGRGTEGRASHALRLLRPAGCRVVQKDFTPSEEDPSLKTYVAHMLDYIM